MGGGIAIQNDQIEIFSCVLHARILGCVVVACAERFGFGAGTERAFYESRFYIAWQMY